MLKSTAASRLGAGLRSSFVGVGRQTREPICCRLRAIVYGIRRPIWQCHGRNNTGNLDFLLAMIAAADGSLVALRDRALLLLLGFAGAFRSSELVALDCEDIEETTEGTQDHR
jgi:hypothetical protein